MGGAKSLCITADTGISPEIPYHAEHSFGFGHGSVG